MQPECLICEKEISKHTCKKCGKPVGDNCYNKDNGLCRNCMCEGGICKI